MDHPDSEPVAPTSVGTAAADVSVGPRAAATAPAGPASVVEAVPATRTYKRERISKVWLNYDFIEVPDAENPGKTKQMERCKMCGETRDPESTSGTSHFGRHAKSCSKRFNIDLRQTRIAQTTHGNITSFQFNQARARKNLIKLLIVRELPFQFVEDPYFQFFVNDSFHPGFTSFSRGTVRNDVLKYFKDEKHELKNTLKSCPCRISLTSDIWQSKQNLSYLSITAHFIDSSWILHKRIISYALIDKSHTGENIAQLIHDKLANDWEIAHKIFCLSMDNASANTVSVSKLKQLLPKLPVRGDLFHVRCCCHILNLVVQDGLKVQQFKNMLEHIKGNLEYISVSGTRYVQFRTLCEANGMPPKKLQLDVKHRWNSTYIMLRDAIPYRHVITLFLSDRASPYSISDSDWKYAELLCKFLRPFYDATNFFSGVDYVTANHVLEYLLEIGLVFKEHRNDEMFEDIIATMEVKFVKYWGETPLLFGIACILDPRIKTKVELVLTELEVCFETSSSTIKCSSTQSLSMVSKLQELFAEYTCTINERLSASSSTTTNLLSSSVAGPSEASTTSSRGAFWRSINRGRRDPMATASEELARYNAEPEPGSDDFEMFDVLGWWKDNEKRFPVLSTIARDVLTVPVSTVASESAFSLGKRVLGDYRSSLTPEMLECCVVLKDWWKAQFKKLLMPFDPLNDDITPLEAVGDWQTSPP